MPSAIPGSACSGCRSGAGARSSQDCRGQRQTAATPAHRLRLSLHKVRLRRPLRHLFATPCSGTSPASRRSRSESRAGFCAMASRSARVWGGTPVWITARTCKPCALRTGNAQKLPFVLKTVLRQISCCQVKQVWKILIQRSRSEARPYILLLIYFILLFRPSISPLLIEYFMAFLMGEMSRWTLFTKLTTSP